MNLSASISFIPLTFQAVDKIKSKTKAYASSLLHTEFLKILNIFAALSSLFI